MAPTLAATPLFVTSSTVNTNTLTSSSFTPANGEVIVVKLATGDTTVSMGAPTGGSQTYTSGSPSHRAGSAAGRASTPP
jgi:hypothetical protein